MSTVALYRRRITRSLEGCRFKPSLKLCMFEDGFCLDLFGFLIALPFMDRYLREPKEMMESWGVYLNDGWRWNAIVWCWGDYVKFFHMPWQFTHIKTEVRRHDGSFVKAAGGYGAADPDKRRYWTMPFMYVLQNGTVQNRTATMYVERREWRRRWTKWLPLFAMVRTSLWIDFDDEVGEGTGSWKGGTVGCGWDLRRGETVPQAFKRMEATRKFD